MNRDASDLGSAFRAGLPFGHGDVGRLVEHSAATNDIGTDSSTAAGFLGRLPTAFNFDSRSCCRQTSQVSAGRSGTSTRTVCVLWSWHVGRSQSVTNPPGRS